MGENKMSNADWNKMVDDLVSKENKNKGMTSEPSPEHLIPENEYEMGINHRFITQDLIRHFACAIGDPNPLWRDPAYARGTRWGGIIAPPTFEACIAYPPGAISGHLRIPGFNVMAAGNKHEYFGVIRPGDQFKISDKYLGIEEKKAKGKPYRLFLETGERAYINQRDEVIATSTGRGILVGTPPGIDDSQGQLYQDVKRHHFTKEELDTIHRYYDEELEGKWRRGKEVLYWEDVVEGEELKPVVRGPIDMCDACAGMLVNYPWAFAIKWAVMRRELQHHPIDPETGEYRYRRDWHYEDALARIMGMPYAFQEGSHHSALLGTIVTNWMGDDGFIKTLDFQVRRIIILGDAIWIKGKVARKYKKGNEPLVDLEVWGENQDGIKLTTCVATVKLVSRERSTVSRTNS